MTLTFLSGEGHDLVLDLCAHKEKLMKEELHITDSQDPSKSITLILHARVLGKEAFPDHHPFQTSFTFFSKSEIRMNFSDYSIISNAVVVSAVVMHWTASQQVK